MARNVPKQILSGADNADVTGSAFETQQVYSASFCPICSDDSAGGTVKIQGSNDSPVGANTQFTPSNWNDIPNATSTIASGVGPAIVIPVMNFQYIRAVYTASSGGGADDTIIVNADFFSV